MYRQQLSYLKKWCQAQQRKPVLVRGARQVGKSTLVRMLAQECGLALVELNFERNPELNTLFQSNDPGKIIQLVSLQTGQSIQPGTTLLFLDEIQTAADAIVALRYFYEELSQLHVIAAGSLLEFTLSAANFSMPVGRIEYLHLGPMTFMEFLMALGEQRLVDYLANFHLKDEIAQPIHNKLMELTKTYFITGGMPESIQAFIADNTFRRSDKVKQSILSTYQDDFGKYAPINKHALTRKIFNKLPSMIGNKFKYQHISQEKSATIAAALNQLCLARVAWKVHHSSGNGVPLGAEQNDRLFKILFLDIGLVSSSLGLQYLNLHAIAELTMVNEGALAEQFIGQHLLYANPPYQEPNLYYWVREKKSSSAELDYLTSFGPQVIPIEVKAGKTGQMKSLQLFLKEKSHPLGVRFNSSPPSFMLVDNRLFDGSSVRFKFLSLPLYLVEQLNRLLSRV